MAIYQVYFDTQQGEKNFPADIDDTEVLDNAVRDMIAELTDRGYVVKGLSTGDLKVIHEAHELDLSRTLPDQQVRPLGVLRVLIESYEAGSLSIRAERIEQEWKLLEGLCALNAECISLLDRKSRPTEEVFYLRLLGSSGLEAISGQEPVQRNSHTLRLCFPVFYPDVPIECFVKEPLIHPNVKLDSGFVCLWEQFSLGDNVIHAVCRAQAIAAYRLINMNNQHIMNPSAAEWYLKVAKPQGLVPLSWSELKIFSVEGGHLKWLDPRRQARRKLSAAYD